MKIYNLIALLIFLFMSSLVYSQAARMLPEVTPEGKGKVNTKVDNIGYWSRMVQLGYVRANPKTVVPEARFNGTVIRLYEPSRVTRHASRILNSPDVPVTGETNVTQSENSIFIDPSDENIVLNSNNSSSWISGYADTPYGADALYSFDNGQNWAGSTRGVNGTNAGDPSTAIGLNGWWYVGRITGDYGQAVSYSKDRGLTWTRVKVGQGPTVGIGLLDKNHLWIDNSQTSPFKGNLYCAWTNFIPGDSDTNQVEIVRSTNQGLTWSAPVNISSAASALKLNHGVNIQTGPNGEVYAAWSIYDTWPSDETAIGFAKSFNGGGVFMPATRIISNIKGIRSSMTGKNMRVSSFPCMTVDNSTGPNRGTIYLVWCNVGYPGINTGFDIDIYLISSADGGSTWSAPNRVNQDPPGLGKQHYLPWITCDRVTGGVCVVYYDDRNTDSTSAAVFVSVSYDEGNTWTDMQVSDYTFTPEPIPGLAFSYFGDYIGIQSDNMKVYPIWTDNHENGRAMTYVSPFDLGPNPNQPWVLYYSDSLATVSGTGNVLMTYGDSLYLSLGLKNIGDQQASGVTAVISTTSPYIMITDSTANYDTIGPGQVKIVQNGNTFKVSDTIPDNLMVRFDVQVTDTDSTWYSHFAIEAHAPGLKINGITIVDTLNGNHNGRLDPGETVQVMVPTANTGDFPCQATYGLLSSASPFLTLLTDSVFLNNIPPKQAKNAIFTVVVSPEAPIGSGADLTYTAHSGLYTAKRKFREIISMIVEDWETNSFTKFPWQSGGAKPWVINSLNPWEGTYSAASGVINNYQNSQMFISYASVADDSISFYLRTSTEQDYDFLMFSIDGVLQAQWSGETTWTRAAFPVAAGQHVFKWIYLKDLAYISGFDRVWVDFIALPPPILPVVEPGPDDTICAGLNVTLQATALQYDSIKWTTTGDGVFSNDTTLFTIYTPGTYDLISGNVTLRLTGFGPFGSMGKNKHISINPRPVASITSFPGSTVCEGQSVLLSADTTGISTWHWTPGNFTASEATYDTLNTGGAGVHLIRLTVTNAFQCQNRDSVYLTFKNCTAISENPESAVHIYPNPGNGLILLEVETQKAGPVKLSVANALGDVVFRDDDPLFRKIRRNELNLTFLPDGVYLLSLTTIHGTTAHKLIIRK
ncbi:MAG: T9SS type A sorting domain-containing protein [Bacteroidales bacterium]|nr:T9SS type A sorting domain-containing protein [Bacteroidales bacterium]